MSREPNCWEKTSQTVNNKIEDAFEGLGVTIGRNPYPFLAASLVFVVGFSIGLVNIEKAFETDLFNLFTPTNSPVFAERKFVADNWGELAYGQLTIATVGKKGENIMTKAHFDEWYKLHLVWRREFPGTNITWKGKPVELAFWDHFTTPRANKAGNATRPWGNKLELCRPFSSSPTPALFYMPCYGFDIFDCFSEGGYKFPFETYLSITPFGARFPANPYLVRPSYIGLSAVEVGTTMGPSCKVWTGTITIPSNFLMGGVTRSGPNESSPITSIKSFETIFFADSADGLVTKLNVWTGRCNYTSLSVNCPTSTKDDLDEAKKILFEWYKLWIDYFLPMTKAHNTDSNKLLEIVFFTPRSTRDLLAAASSADFGLLIVAYVAMIVFAALAAVRPTNWFGSKAETSVAGVLLVLMTVLATIGFGVLVVKLSPNVIQILPFIALGFGVDDMLVLLFAYRYIEKGREDPDHVAKLMGQTLRIAGSSVALTSIANLLGFAVGATMPLPDVARFAKYGMIVVSFNFLTVIFGFSAILTLTARRQQAGKRDFGFICCFSSMADADPQTDPDPDATDVTMLDPLYDVLANTYVRIAVLVIALTFFAIGIYGSTLARVGLPLDNIVPTNHYTAPFLRVRVQYYGSYDQSLYTNAKGADRKSIDWPNKIGLFANLSRDIRSFDPKLVYSDPALVSSWALKFVTANKKEYAGLWDAKPFQAKTISSLAKAPPMIIRPADCRTDIYIWCSNVHYSFTRASPLLLCLQHHIYDLTSNVCRGWVIALAIPPLASIPATVVEVISPFDASVAGFYATPFGDTTGTYAKMKANGIGFAPGHIFQSPRLAMGWAILGADGEIIYHTKTTKPNDLPPQTGWMKPDGSYARISITASNLITAVLKVPRKNFPPAAYAVTSHDFAFKSKVTVPPTPSVSYELFQRELGGRSAWSTVVVSFTNLADPAQVTTISCSNATSSVPSEVCYALGSGQPMLTGSSCGADTWWLGNCGTAPTLVHAAGQPPSGGLNFSAYNATSGKLYFDPTSANYAAACKGGATSAFTQYQPVTGTGQIGGSAGKDTSAPNVEVSVQCVPKSCNHISACYAEIQSRGDLGGGCDLASFLPTKSGFAGCGARLINSGPLSSCCQSALDQAFSLLQCSEFENKGATLDAFCAKHPYCKYNASAITKCTEPVTCTGGGFAEACAPHLNYLGCTYNFAAPSQAGNDALVSCMKNGPGTLSNLPGDAAPFGGCCRTLLRGGYWPTYQNCTIEVNSHYDGNNYLYSSCEPFLAQQGCTGGAPGSFTQFDCLVKSNLAWLNTSASACCKKFLTAQQPVSPATGQYGRSVTKDCSPDAVVAGCLTGLGWLKGTTAVIACVKAKAGHTLSGYCAQALGLCPTNALPDSWLGGNYKFAFGRSRYPAGVFHPTPVGVNYTNAPCQWGYTGNQIRLCTVDSAGAPMWAPIDKSSCVVQSCSAKANTFGLPVPATRGGMQYATFIPASLVPAALAAFAPCKATVPAGFAYITSRCLVNTTDATVYWATDTILCQNIPPNVTSTPNVGCNPATSSVIGVTPFSAAAIPGVFGACILNPQCIAVEMTNALNGPSTALASALISYDYCEQIPIVTGEPQFLHVVPLDIPRLLCALCTKADKPTPIPNSCVNRWTGEPKPACFYSLLWWYLYNPTGLGILNKDRFIFGNDAYRAALASSSGFQKFLPTPGQPDVIKSTRVGFAVRGIIDDAVAVEYILKLRKRLTEWDNAGLPTIASGLIFNLYSQYIGVGVYIGLNCLYVGIAISVVCMLFLWNPVAVIIVLICDAMMITEVVGFVEWSGLRINGVLALNLVIAIGLTMEFTAHMARAFIVADGDNADIVGAPGWQEGQVRMKKAMRSMFIPITLGAVTTVLGISPIAGAQFPYFRQYYFLLYIMIVCFGWFNGVIAQPVLLSFLNPRAFPKNKLETMSSEIAMGDTHNSTNAGETA